MPMLDRIDRLAARSRARVAIGRARKGDAADLTVSLAEAAGLGRVEVATSARALVSALVSGRAHAAVRGTLGADDVLHRLAEGTHVRTPGRAALIEMGNRDAVLLAPVGIDEGRTLAQRGRLLDACAATVASLGAKPRIAVMSKGRPEDRGRGSAIARSIRECDELVRRARRTGLDAEATHILVERALGRCNVLIAPDGVAGNLLFRTLHYAMGLEVWGALALFMLPMVYVDTSRDKRDFLGAVKWARATAASLDLGRD
jgi:predicted methyltransferase MtxX (methanogen marker protein 4)